MFRPFEAFHVEGRFISVVGSGGKTTFLRWLSVRLPGTVILTTSTHMFPFPDMPTVDAGGESSPESRERVSAKLRAALGDSRVIGLGRLQASGKLADPSAVIPFEALLDMADYVVVEADGAAGRPLKAHRPWEPVVPACSTMTVGVVGASGMGRPAALACHCPERFCALARLGIDEPVGPEHVAAVLNQEALADCWLVNQLDALADPEQARWLCDLIEVDAFPCSLGR
jgi:probable selenium-dependent hydroxylase accessory protein YqeC